MMIDGYKTYPGDNFIIYANVKILCSTPETNNIVCQLYFILKCYVHTVLLSMKFAIALCLKEAMCIP